MTYCPTWPLPTTIVFLTAMVAGCEAGGSDTDARIAYPDPFLFDSPRDPVVLLSDLPEVSATDESPAQDPGGPVPTMPSLQRTRSCQSAIATITRLSASTTA